MARLDIMLFGPFQLMLDGEPVAGIDSDKVRALLAYLALEADRPHRPGGCWLTCCGQNEANALPVPTCGGPWPTLPIQPPLGYQVRLLGP